MPEVSVIIVCMNRPDLLYPCLEGIRAHTTVSYEVLVVAYLFSAENLARLRADWPEVQVVESRELRGFSENNNLALRQAAGKYCFILPGRPGADERPRPLDGLALCEALPA